MELLQEIIEAKEGSDIHGIVQRVAHKLHLDGMYQHEKENWFYASKKVDSWLKDHLLMQNGEDVDFTVKESIRHHAKNIYKCRRCKPGSRSWFDAMDHIAEMVYTQ
ncbi:hypothetical protein BMS3Abin17_00174 [archaeon BMS3Abin17]|nr:hypothetical protein BMS3Abin17_00174 [archaeon BMS3Abin17]HDZ61081.1 hypothetical protein [Candidatus Pacearchaeota archaeon]